jgi:glycosyltransferase involved in cell wall biosynthesis
MKEPSFDVVMAAYNASATIETAIRSVLGQTRPDFELIVVDDGSTDDTASRVDQFCANPRVRLIRQENRGLPAARNAAVGAGRGRYVTILDSDDLLMPAYLERIGRALEETPGAGFAFADAWRLDQGSGRFWRQTQMTKQRAPRPVPTDPDALLPALVKSNFVPVMFTVRRTALEHVGQFRVTGAEVAEDWELLLRLVAFGYRPAVVPGVLAIYRQNMPGGFTIDPARMLRLSLETLRVFVVEDPASTEVKTVARARGEEMRAKLERTTRRRPLVTKLRKRLRGPASLIRRDPLRRQPPPDISAAFPDLARP